MVGSPLILIVDDDPAVRTSLERLMKSAGFRVASFASTEEFLNEPQDDVVACLVLDMKLPGANGQELQQRLAAEKRAIPIIFISADDEPHVRAQALRAGAIAFLSKPFDEDALLKAIHSVLQR
ncbi:MAG TPA: response regulator [Candidatus Angelobacter sp.]|nr:response regulator [Candidatus Angelobacter sp.]